jgi:hypothetical protein
MNGKLEALLDVFKIFVPAGCLTGGYLTSLQGIVENDNDLFTAGTVLFFLGLTAFVIAYNYGMDRLRVKNKKLEKEVVELKIKSLSDFSKDFYKRRY